MLLRRCVQETPDAPQPAKGASEALVSYKVGSGPGKPSLDVPGDTVCVPCRRRSAVAAAAQTESSNSSHLADSSFLALRSE